MTFFSYLVSIICNIIQLVITGEQPLQLIHWEVCQEGVLWRPLACPSRCHTRCWHGGRWPRARIASPGVAQSWGWLGWGLGLGRGGHSNRCLLRGVGGLVHGVGVAVAAVHGGSMGEGGGDWLWGRWGSYTIKQVGSASTVCQHNCTYFTCSKHTNKTKHYLKKKRCYSSPLHWF